MGWQRCHQGGIPGDVTAEASARDVSSEWPALRHLAQAGSIGSRPHFDPFLTSDYLPERNDSEVLLQVHPGHSSAPWLTQMVQEEAWVPGNRPECISFIGLFL